jgi:hypothetical protein
MRGEPPSSLLTKKFAVSVARKNELQKEKKFAPIAWVRSGCDPWPGRKQYVTELMKHIKVDSYGKCLHNRELPFKEGWYQNSDTYQSYLAGYKFYLATPNCVCDDYVDDNFWLPLWRGHVPIWGGDATRGAIDAWAPLRGKSYISMLDFDSPAALAAHITYLDGNDTAYSEYLQWRAVSADEFNPSLQERWRQSRPEVGGCELCDAMLRNKRVDPTGRVYVEGKAEISKMTGANLTCSAKGISGKWGREPPHDQDLVDDMINLTARIWEWRRSGDRTVAEWERIAPKNAHQPSAGK